MTAADRPHFVRYRDLTPTEVNVELQMHTVQTDGQATAAELLGAASERGLSAVAFTEHVRRSTDWFPAFAADVRAAAARVPGVRAYVGIEAKALDETGGFDATDALVAASEIVLGSVHRFPDGQGGVREFAGIPATEMAETECRLALGLLRHAPIDVLAHPGGMYQRRYGAYPADLFREMMVVSLERSVAIEINASYLVDVEGFLELCDEINPYVSVGSDVHRLDEMGRCRDRLFRHFKWNSNHLGLGLG